MTAVRISPLKQIRKHCIDCAGDSKKEVRLCEIRDCNLWLLRFGRKPTETELLAWKEAMAADDTDL